MTAGNTQNSDPATDAGDARARAGAQSRLMGSRHRAHDGRLSTIVLSECSIRISRSHRIEQPIADRLLPWASTNNQQMHRRYLIDFPNFNR